jgi:hypothetical protein
MDDIEKFEELPSRISARREHAYEGYDAKHYRNDYGTDWRKVRRWLKSRLNKPWSRVSADYVRLDWVPKEDRRVSVLANTIVEVNTFMKDGEVCFLSGKEVVRVKDAWQEVIYVHPITTNLQYKPIMSKAKRRAMWRGKGKNDCRQLGPYNQLLKLDGVWYHVWADPIDYRTGTLYPANLPLIYDKKRIRRSYHIYDRDVLEYICNRPKIYKVQLTTRQLKQYGLKNDTQDFIWNPCHVCGMNGCYSHHIKN